MPLVNTSVRSPQSASSWRNQFESVCGEHPSSTASCFGDLAPLRNNLIASSRNSGGYGGLVLSEHNAQTDSEAKKAAARFRISRS